MPLFWVKVEVARYMCMGNLTAILKQPFQNKSSVFKTDINCKCNFYKYTD